MENRKTVKRRVVLDENRHLQMDFIKEDSVFKENTLLNQIIE